MAKIVLDRLAAQFTAGEIIETGSQHGNEWARIRREDWVVVSAFLRDDPETQMDMFVDLTVVDRLSKREELRFDVVLHLYSLSKKHRVRLYAGVSEDDPIIDT